MKQTVEAGKTLLVNGPASVKILSGAVQVFGYTIRENQQIIVREGKRQPFLALEKTEFHVSLGANAAVQEAEASTIPEAWNEPLQSIKAIKNKPTVIMIVGKADSGKSSFSTYLVNNLIDGKNKVAVLDGDLGQSDIGPPCTVAYGVTSKQVTEIYELKVSNAFFVGVTSPIQAVTKTLEGLISMHKEIMQKAEADYVIVNTDGWIEGDAAINYKLQLVNQLKPDLVIGIQNQEELKLLLSSIVSVPTRSVWSSVAVSERNPEKRTRQREINYARHLKEAKVRSFVASYMEIQEKQVIPKEPGKEKGILVGLFNAKKHFLGIGILLEYNRPKKIMKVLTPVKSKPASIAIGKIKLDPELKEVPLTS
jgi:polynucleotide 5'-hydroxyl-kinase GRC3/NOL9